MTDNTTVFAQPALWVTRARVRERAGDPFKETAAERGAGISSTLAEAAAS